MDPQIRTVRIFSETDVATARLLGGRLADQAGFNQIQKHCVMTSVSELASNILRHAGSGGIDMQILFQENGNKGVEVIAFDQGRGILDLHAALQDGYSTCGGLGGGLSGVNRLMSEMVIESTQGKGTVVRAVKWIDETHLSNTT